MTSRLVKVLGKRPGFAWTLVATGVLAFGFGCSDPFGTCEAARACPVTGGSGGIGAGGEGGDGGELNQGGEGGAGGAPEPCAADAPSECVAFASPERKVCKDGFFTTESCAEGELCDRADGSCRPIVPGCENLIGGEGFCENDTLRRCGPDLVTTLDQKCSGRCDHGECVSPACGDGKLQAGEDCDDANLEPGDGCSPACHYEPIALKLGASFGCALFKDARLKCWGDNHLGQLGIGTYDTLGDDPGELGSKLPVTASGVLDFAVGAEHACVLTKSGVSCWGGNRFGQLGRASMTPEATPNAMSVPLGNGVVGLSAGANHTCALFEDGSVTCFGSNNAGQLGQNVVSAYEPHQVGQSLAQVSLPDPVTELANGGQSSCALDPHGLRCWGLNSSGQLGNGTADNLGSSPDDPPPVLVNFGSNWLPTGAALGASHACAWNAVGVLKCWGDGFGGALGSESQAPRGTTPSDLGIQFPAVPLADSVITAGAGSANTCAVLSNHTVECWGMNDYGQLGRPDFTDTALGDDTGEMAKLAPVDLGDNGDVKAIALGHSYACALLTRGVIKCWGRNDAGQLGVGNTDTPTEFGNALPETTLD